MAVWRVRMGGWLLALGLGVGCGGALPEEGGDEPGTQSEEQWEALASVCPPREANTQRVKAILPPSSSIPRYAPGPTSFTSFQGRVFFAVNREDGSRGLWKSDGSAAGTVPVKELPAIDGRQSPPLEDLAASPSLLFFEAADAAHGSEPWVSDGTAAGTRLLKDLTPGAKGSSLDRWTILGSRAVFFRTLYTPTSTGWELWASDGTSAGTVRLRDFTAGSEVVSHGNLKLGNGLLFFLQDDSGTAVWRTDGTAAGTVRLKRLDSGSASVADPRVAGKLGFFTLTDNGETEIWKTDGTAAGTVRLSTYGSARAIQLLGVLGSQLYLTTTPYDTQAMTVSRIPVAGGTSTSVATLPNAYTSQGEAFPIVEQVSAAPGGRKLFFSITIGSDGPAPRDTQLWGTDGTRAGTMLLRRPLSLSDEYSSPILAVAEDLIFFSASEGGGIEPWVSNGTPGGARRLKDISPTNSSYPRDFFQLGARVYFSAVDETRAGQLWSTALSTTCAAPVDG